MPFTSARLHGAIASRPRRRHASRGFSLIEVLMAAAILAIALLGHTAASWSASRMATTERSRSEGMRFCQQFIERLRAEDDWGALHSRMMVLEAVPGTADYLQLNNGQRCRPVTDYFADFNSPPPSDRCGVRVDVPGAIQNGLPVLREDTVAPEFGLPADLNGDGVIDSDNHANDYVALPVVIRIRYRLQGEQSYEVRMATWLRGNR